MYVILRPVLLHVVEEDEGGALNKRLRHLHSLQQQNTSPESAASPNYAIQPCKTTILFLVVHGG